MGRQLGVVILLSLAGRPLYCQTPLNERVLVVYNSNASESLAVARHYMAQRKIPESNRCAIAPSSTDYLNQNEYESRVKAPLRKCIEAVGKQKVLYIVFSYRTPYVVQVNDRGFALDSFVADLWDEYSPTRPGNEMPGHPYFGEAQSQGNFYGPYIPLAAYRDQLRAANIYSVWRLDAATAELAKGLVDKALYAETNGLSGKACFDRQSGAVENLSDSGSASGDWDIHQAADFARRAGFEVVEDDKPVEFGTAPAPLRCDGAALYAGWYSLNHYNDAFTWNPGAIGLHLDSASAANPRGGSNWAANAVMKGISITSGAAAEPYLEGLAHPDQVFLYLFQGANAGDALLRSTRWLKWMILNIGDPLYRPFPKGAPVKAQRDLESTLALLPQSVPGGTAASGLVAFSVPAPEGGTIVTLSSSRPDVVNVPRTVTIPAKTQGARFPIITHPVNEDGVGVRISMGAGEAGRSNTMTVYPCMPPLTFSATKAGGGEQVVGTVLFYQPAGADGVTVKLSSDKPELASVPPEVKVPAGASRAAFQIATHATTAASSVALTAAIGGCARSGSFTVVP
jgi:uncharacterized protein (TIGR03790 family)